MKYIVYLTVNTINGKFYFGVHHTNPDVFDGYIGGGIYRQNQATKKCAFHKAVKKYGYSNFKRTTIQEFPDTEDGKKQAYELEKQLVTPVLLKSKTCYNTALGGEGSEQLEKSKRVYMFSLKGEFLRSYKNVTAAATEIAPDNVYNVKKAIRNNCLGFTQTSTGYVWSYTKEFHAPLTNSTKIAQYTLDGNLVTTFESIAEAEQMLSICTISQALRKHCSAGGYQWRYYTAEETLPQYISTANKNTSLPIVMIDNNGNETYYNNVKECVYRHPECKAAQINRVLKGIIKTHKNYIFRYKDDDIVS